MLWALITRDPRGAICDVKVRQDLWTETPKANTLFQWQQLKDCIVFLLKSILMSCAEKRNPYRGSDMISGLKRMNLVLRKTSTFPFLPLLQKQRETLIANITLKNRAQTPAPATVKWENCLGVMTLYSLKKKNSNNTTKTKRTKKPECSPVHPGIRGG